MFTVLKIYSINRFLLNMEEKVDIRTVICEEILRV